MHLTKSRIDGLKYDGSNGSRDVRWPGGAIKAPACEQVDAAVLDLVVQEKQGFSVPPCSLIGESRS
jgi:hypothetical protein